MVEDDNFIPDDSELEFLKQEQDTALFNKGYDEPIDNKFLWNYIGGRQMGYGGDELKIIEKRFLPCFIKGLKNENLIVNILPIIFISYEA